MPNKKILLVDNMELALQMEEEILRRSGLDILTAGSGLEALELVKSQRPDLVLLESNMPEMSGYDCCRAIKADPELQKTPVIIMLTEATPQIIDQCYEANCEDVLTKPLEQDVVLGKITALLEIKTRKLPRLQIKTSVLVERTGKSLTVESINLNRQGILVSSPEGFQSTENFRLSFAVSPADQMMSLWSRLERQVEPGSEKNPGTSYLVLFRFLQIPPKAADRIDQLAMFQAQQAGKSSGGVPGAGRLTGLEVQMKTPIEVLRPHFEALVKNIGASLPGVDPTTLSALQLVVVNLRPWEKNLKASDPDAEFIRNALLVRAKLAADIKAAEAFPQLSGDEQTTLRALQASYFKEPEQILEQLQPRINVHMQSGNLDRMKEINQTKTETFRLLVALKALLNRILDPKAALEATQFQQEGGDTYKAEAFERPKPVEATAKPAEFVFDKQAKKSNRGIKIAITCFLLFVVLPIALYFALNAKPPGVTSSEDPEAQIKIETPLPIARVKERAGMVTIYVTPAWDLVQPDQREALARAAYAEIRAKGFVAFQIADNLGSPVYARGTRRGQFQFFNPPAPQR